MSLIEASDWGWRYAGRQAWAAHGLDLTIEAGERVLLLGASGAGKSTLLLGLAGVLGGADEGSEAGRLLIDGQHPTRRVGQVGLVQQDPAAQIILARVGDDVAFGCENLGVAPTAIWQRVRQGLTDVGLDVPLDRATTALSGGQQQRLAIAGLLAMQDPANQKRPRLLLLDEPTANLDPAGIAEVKRAVARVVEDRSVGLIVVEHHVDVWLDLIDRVVVLGRDGGVAADGPAADVFAHHGRTLAADGVWVPGVALPGLPRPAVDPAVLRRTLAEPIIQGIDLTIGYQPHQPVRQGLNVAIPQGLSTVIVGPNGAGKSTLALTLAGLLPQLGGRVAAADALTPPASRRRRARADPADPHQWSSAELLTRLGTVFQEAEHQFVAATVSQELAVGLKALGWDQARIAARVEELLALLHLAHLTQANPFTLSGGEKRRLSVGTVLAAGPQVIILDEPTFGQDRTTWLDLVALIDQLLDDGRTIISVSHDPDYLARFGQYVIDLGP